MMKKFTLFVGLNDKDTKRQEISTADALTFTHYMLLNHVDGATISTAKGIYRHDNGDIVTENTIRIELLFINDETVKHVVEKLKNHFNQESVAVQIEEVKSYLW